MGKEENGGSSSPFSKQRSGVRSGKGKSAEGKALDRGLCHVSRCRGSPLHLEGGAISEDRTLERRVPWNRGRTKFFRSPGLIIFGRGRENCKRGKGVKQLLKEGAQAIRKKETVCARVDVQKK